MTRHILRRIIQSLPTLFGITLLSYLIMSLAPGGPIALMTFGDDKATEASRQLLAERLGLSDPWHIQYITWLAGNDWMWWKDAAWDRVNVDTGEPIPRPISYGIIRGDFGESFKYRRPAIDMIAERLPATLELGIASLTVSLLLGIPIGIFAAISRGGSFDNFTRVMAVVGNAIPNFWFGLMLLLIVGVMLDDQKIPILNIELQTDWARGGRCDTRTSSRTGCSAIPIHERLQYLILPTIVLSYGGVAGYSRFMRTSMLDTINSDYIRTARAKGLRNRTIWFNHAARNSLIPIATFLGPALVGVLGGAAITESIFTWPGLGRLVVESVNTRDYPVVMASVLISAVLTIIAYIISDILYALFDPRIRF